MLHKADIQKAAAIFLDDHGRVLMSRDVGSTKWQLLGGKIEENESHIDCLKRELKEEINAEIEVEPTLYKEAPVFPAANDPGKTVKLYFYFCRLLSEPELIEDVEELKWVSKQDFENGELQFSEAGKNFVLPNLIKDNYLK